MIGHHPFMGFLSKIESATFVKQNFIQAMKNSLKSITALSVGVLFLHFGAFAQSEVPSNKLLAEVQGLTYAQQDQEMGMFNNNQAQQEYLKKAKEAEVNNLIPLISFYPDEKGRSLHLFNPEELNLSVEIKTESGEQIDGWNLEGLSDNDVRQTIEVSDLKSGVYWVEVSAPNRKMVSMKWTKQ